MNSNNRIGVNDPAGDPSDSGGDIFGIRERAVIVNGSPHRSGNTMALAGLLGDCLGVPVEVVHVYGLGIHPCIGCLGCGVGGVCVEFAEDAMAGVLSLLRRSRFVVIASPLHFTSLSAPLVGLISRLQALWRSGCGLGAGVRVGGYVVSAGGDYPGMFEPGRAVVAAALKTMGVEFAGWVGVGGLDERAPLARAGVTERIGALALKMKDAATL